MRASTTVMDYRPTDEPPSPTRGPVTTGYVFSVSIGAANIRFGLAGDPHQPVFGSLSVDEALSEWVDEAHELAEQFLPAAVEAPEW